MGSRQTELARSPLKELSTMRMIQFFVLIVFGLLISAPETQGAAPSCPKGCIWLPPGNYGPKIGPGGECVHPENIRSRCRNDDHIRVVECVDTVCYEADYVDKGFLTEQYDYGHMNNSFV